MAKRTRKRQGKKARAKPNETEATEVRIAAAEQATGMSATALAAFARDLAAFGSRRDRHPKPPAR
jgi:hypothetical protein